MEWYMYILIVFVGFVAGFINTLAGSGSLLTLPMLMFLGLPANVANGTNRIGILFQSIVGVASFKQQKMLNLKLAWKLAIPATIGALVGAMIAVDINEEIMEKAIGTLLIIMLFIIILKPDKWIKQQAGNVESKTSWWQLIIFFFIGIYGGFIQAGVGFFLLAGLVLGAGQDLIKANALKMFINLSFTIFALLVFIINEHVNYKFGIVLALGNMAGAFFAARFAVSWGTKVVKYFLIVALLASSIKILFF